MIDIVERPTMAPLKVGKEFKTFSVTAKKGMEMPSHISTKEAVVMVQEGKALLKMETGEHLLEKNSVFIIPQGIHHSLSILEDFKAVALMAVDSEIEFD